MDVLTILTDANIKEGELPLFRGAVIAAARDFPDVLFHDHTEDGFRYAYPLIQYKILNGYAAVTAIDGGIPLLEHVFLPDGTSRTMRIGRRIVDVSVADVHRQEIVLEAADGKYAYRMYRWLPLNQENYRAYLSLESLAEKYFFLETLLVGNILSFAKGVRVFFDSEVTASIIDASPSGRCRFKGVDMLGFDVKFLSNVSIPDFVGLGKGVSLGFGTVISDKSIK